MNNGLFIDIEKLIAKKKSIEIARNFKDIVSDEVIAECTGLPIEKVKQL